MVGTGCWPVIGSLRCLKPLGSFVAGVLLSLAASADDVVAGPFSPPYPDGTNAYIADTDGFVFHHPNTSQTGECVWFVRAVRPDGTDFSTSSNGGYPSGWARNIYPNAMAGHWHVGSTPKRGAVMCFQTLAGGVGHVAIVVGTDANGVLVWDSNFGGSATDYQVRKRRVNTNLVHLQGYIYSRDSDDPPSNMFPGSAPNVFWTHSITDNRWYRSDEHLTYHVNGPDPLDVFEIVDQNVPGPHHNRDGYIEVSRGGPGWHEYYVRATNPYGQSQTGGWWGGWDNQAPSANVTGGVLPNVWYLGSPSVSWQCSDAQSNVRRFQYRWDGGGWSNYVNSASGGSSLMDGSHILEVQVEDNAWNGNTQDGNKSVVYLGTFRLDNTPPTVAAPICTPFSPSNASSVQVQVSGDDSQSGVNRIEVYVDGNIVGTVSGATGSTTWNTSTFGEGAHVVTAKAFDNAQPGGNSSSLSATTNYFLDRVAPQTTAALSPAIPDGLNGWYKTAPVVTLQSTDPNPGSGIASQFYQIGQGSWTSYASPFAITQNGHVALSYYSTDFAGNIEATHSQTVLVDSTPPPAPTVEDEGIVTSSQNILNVSITGGIDPDSGLYAIEYMVGLQANPELYRSLTRVLTYDPYLNIEGLSIPSGQSVFVRVRTLNMAGLESSWSTTDGILVDPFSAPFHVDNHVFNSFGDFSDHPEVHLGNTAGELFIGDGSHPEVNGNSGFWWASVNDIAVLQDYAVTAGKRVSGSLSDLLFSEDQYLKLNALQSTGGKRLATEVILGALTTMIAPSSMVLRIETHASPSVASGEVALKNWSTGQFVAVQTYSLTTTDNLVTVSGIGATPYIRADGRIEVRVRSIGAGQYLIDLVRIELSP